MPVYTDNTALIAALKSGYYGAFECVYHRYKDSMFQLAISYLKDSSLAEDALQEVFIKLWNTRADLNENLSLRGFLFTCLKHHILNTIRAEQNRIRIAYRYQPDQATISWETEETIKYNESKRILLQGITHLSEKRKAIIQLNLLEGYSYQEISVMLNISEHTVRSQVCQAKKFLKKYLLDNHIAPLILIFMLCK